MWAEASASAYSFPSNIVCFFVYLIVHVHIWPNKLNLTVSLSFIPSFIHYLVTHVMVCNDRIGVSHEHKQKSSKINKIINKLVLLHNLLKLSNYLWHWWAAIQSQILHFDKIYNIFPHRIHIQSKNKIRSEHMSGWMNPSTVNMRNLLESEPPVKLVWQVIV